MSAKAGTLERAVTDLILARRIGREVVPMLPLGMFSKLDLEYATKEAERQMYNRWDELTEERNRWKDGVLAFCFIPLLAPFVAAPKQAEQLLPSRIEKETPRT
jgi:hypothetical protein